MKILILFISILLILIACTKDVGKNPGLAYSDYALLDSINSPNARNFYKNDSTAILAGTAGPHGPFRFRFNRIAFNALTDNGKLPLGSFMPEGSLVIKEITSAGTISLYAFMYKNEGSWIWGEIKPDREVIWSVNTNPSTCINCHNQSGNRDLITSFNFY